MQHYHLLFRIAALGALPLALFAQSNSSGTSSMNSSSDMSMSLQSVNSDSLQTQVTAKNLIGKEVHDRNGKKIGSVIDVLLPGQSSSLAGAFSSNSSSSNSSSSLSASDSDRSTGNASLNGTNSSSQGPGGNMSAAGGATPTTSSGYGNDSSHNNTGSTYSSSSSPGSSGMNSPAGTYSSSSTMSNEPAAVIRLGSMLSGNRNLVQVPLSQLTYDSSQNRIMLNVSDSDLSRFKGSNHNR